MKIYTKTGDEGITSLLGGKRVDKHHPQIETHGAIDELNSWIGLLISFPSFKIHKALLTSIQNQLFMISANLTQKENKLPKDAITLIEHTIDDIETKLPSLQNFILPGGNSIVAQCHIARCVCRRAERTLSVLTDKALTIKPYLQYLNRLSDLLFVMAREQSKILNIKEVIWREY